MPLHVAVSHGVPLEVVQRLTLAYPEALRVATDAGRWPLHVAMKNGASWAAGLRATM